MNIAKSSIAARADSHNQELSPTEKEQLEQRRNEWLAIYTCTEPADRAQAEEGIAEKYACEGRKMPPCCIWVQSPLAANVVISRLENEESLNDKPLTTLLLNNASSDVKVPYLLQESAGLQESSELYKLAVTKYTFEIGSNTIALATKCKIYKPNSLGQFDAPLIGYYLFCRDVLDVKYDTEENAQLEAFAKITKSCFWWWLFEECVVICERPLSLEFDEKGKITKVTFRDGFTHSLKTTGFEPVSLNSILYPPLI